METGSPESCEFSLEMDDYPRFSGRSASSEDEYCFAGETVPPKVAESVSQAGSAKKYYYNFVHETVILTTQDKDIDCVSKMGSNMITDAIGIGENITYFISD